jgi:AMMECR1 domain-containing protein
MTDLRKAAQEALEALEYINKDSFEPLGIPLPGEIDITMDALRAALAQPQRKPLTEDEISEIAMDCSFVSESDTYFARAIEKAHGIE